MELRGIGIGTGVAVGPVLRMADPLPEPGHEAPSGDAAGELSAAASALSEVSAGLASLAQGAGGVAGEILAAQSHMAVDPMLADLVEARIGAGSSAERAVFDAFAEFESALTALGGVMAERAADLRDVCQRVIAQLRGVPVPALPVSDEPFVLVAADLAPADTVRLPLGSVLAVITRDGGPTSHTAILARERGIPAIVAVAGALDLADGTVVIVDAASGTITVDPSREAIALARETRVVPLSLEPGRLADGTPIALLANLGSVEDAATAVALGAEGVGLFRTEFLFLGRSSAPTVQEQRETYSALLSHFPGRKVVVRVLDAGADKPLPFLAGTEEPNPALGLRGLRALRANESVLSDQLTALSQAAAGNDADLWVMAPMVSDAADAKYFVDLARAAGLRTVGVMAEVPSIALVADRVLDIADFVSIGTNDLTQYTLAADRLLASVAHLQRPEHPAVLRLIELIGDAGAATGKPVGVCGEAAADPSLAVVLVGLGANSLSMAPSAIAAVRAALAGVTLEEARTAARAALDAP